MDVVGVSAPPQASASRRAWAEDGCVAGVKLDNDDDADRYGAAEELVSAAAVCLAGGWVESQATSLVGLAAERRGGR